MQSLHQNEKSSFLSIRLRADKRKSDHSLILLRFASLNVLVNKLTLKAKYKFITSNSDAQVIKKKTELSTECVTLKLSLVDVCSLEKGNFLTSMKNKMT